MLATEILVWGLVAGLVNTAAMVVFYSNPWVARIHRHHQRANVAGQSSHPGPRRFTVHFLGTQLEAYVMTIGYAWLHPLLPMNGLTGAMALAAFFAALRVCAPVWALWTMGTYSSGYLAVEVASGVLSSIVITLALYVLM
ncbi:hypothetical protein OHA40_33960 [Nocardia sp. NBC_00508]|uniref:hypothetical protein n=1 Tax=Nocardia sp. NBC_00508 TaxID=2975992 RepID=UPI002E818BB6|nr:hypothetical protein [Nocardia sp. NBC_00508]WUD66492.1 hypothetical protein OHA40_33960 [Nocardia sp. NBC_00508]